MRIVRWGRAVTFNPEQEDWEIRIWMMSLERGRDWMLRRKLWGKLLRKVEVSLPFLSFSFSPFPSSDTDEE